MVYYGKRKVGVRKARPSTRRRTQTAYSANFAAAASRTIPGGRVRPNAGVMPGNLTRRRQRLPTRDKKKDMETNTQQFTTENKTTGRIMRSSIKSSKLLKSAREQYIYSFKAHKAFDDNGYLWAAQSINNTQRLFPIYALLLNGRETGIAPSCAPLRRLAAYNVAGADDGRLLWNDVVGIDPSTGVAGTQYLLQEYRATSSHPGQSQFHDWSEVKLNLWGAKSKAIKWSIMVCKVYDENDSPWTSTSGSLLPIEAQQAWEEMIRQYTYNPIMKLNYEKRKNRIKILKTWEKVLQPNTSIDGDADPPVHVFKWFSRWNRNVNYDDVTSTQTTGERTTDDVDYGGAKEATQYIQEPYSNYPNVKEQIFMLIRASSYTCAADSGASVTNESYASFDVSLRSKFTRLD